MKSRLLSGGRKIKVNTRQICPCRMRAGSKYI